MLKEQASRATERQADKVYSAPGNWFFIFKANNKAIQSELQEHRLSVVVINYYLVKDTPRILPPSPTPASVHILPSSRNSS